MNSEQPPLEPSYPGGKAAERRREQLAREFGEETPEPTSGDAEADQEPDESDEHDNGAPEPPEE